MPSYQVRDHGESLFNKEAGATLVEFALISILFFGLIGAVIDFAIIFHKYSLVTHVTNTVVRKLAVDFAGRSGEKCETLEEEARKAAESFVEEDMGISSYILVRDESTGKPGELSFCAEVRPVPSGVGQTRIVLEARLELKCLVFCLLIPREWKIRSRSLTNIEKYGFSCSGDSAICS